MSIRLRPRDPDSEPSITEWLATGEHDDLDARSLASPPPTDPPSDEAGDWIPQPLPAPVADPWPDIPDYPLDLVEEGTTWKLPPATDWDDWEWQYDLNHPLTRT